MLNRIQQLEIKKKRNLSKQRLIVLKTYVPSPSMAGLIHCHRQRAVARSRWV